MHRFLKTLGFLVAALLVLVSGVSSAFDRLVAVPMDSTVTMYGPGGKILLTYEGDATQCEGLVHLYRAPWAGTAPRA